MNPIVVTVAQGTKHAILRTLSVLCVLAVIGLLGLGVKRILYPRATQSYAQQAEQIQNYEYYYSKPDDRLFLGLSVWGWRIGLTWQGKQEIVEKK